MHGAAERHVGPVEQALHRCRETGRHVPVLRLGENRAAEAETHAPVADLRAIVDPEPAAPGGVGARGTGLDAFGDETPLGVDPVQLAPAFQCRGRAPRAKKRRVELPETRERTAWSEIARHDGSLRPVTTAPRAPAIAVPRARP